MNAAAATQVNQTLTPGTHVHLVGIGGAGMSAIARVLLGRGCVVSGSDRQANVLTAALADGGATIFEGHAAEQIGGAAMLVISSAIPGHNPEVAAARAAGVPVYKRADFLGLLLADKIGIAVAGTHGKSTTTGMISQMLLTADLDPSIIVGGVLPLLGSNGRAGQGDHFVIEADEYDNMFLGMRPQIAVVTNMEHDHPDVFATPADYEAAFRAFTAQVPAGGTLIACGDDAGARALLLAEEPAGTERIGYGLAAVDLAAGVQQLTAGDERPNQLGGTDFLVSAGQETLGLIRLRVPGRYNVRNALAALAVGRQLGLSFSVMRQALFDFGGIGRRFQRQGEVGDVLVIDDYAHHPTEIRATLAAAREQFTGRRIWAVWQPHTYSRTKLLLAEFATSFGAADRVLVLDIYASREKDNLGLTAAAVAAAINPPAVYAGDRAASAAYLLARVRPGDVVMTLGAGDGDAVGRWLLDGLAERVGTV